MKKMTFLVLLSSLVFSSFTLAATLGSAPKCTRGKFNMQVYVKGINGCEDRKKYCIYDMRSDFHDDGKLTCEDFESLFVNNDNESVSLEKMPSYAQIEHQVANFETKADERQLRFVYDNGNVYDNCAEVFGPDVQCVIHKSGDSQHPLYTLTISKN